MGILLETADKFSNFLKTNVVSTCGITQIVRSHEDKIDKIKHILDDLCMKRQQNKQSRPKTQTIETEIITKSWHRSRLRSSRARTFHKCAEFTNWLYISRCTFMFQSPQLNMTFKRNSATIEQQLLTTMSSVPQIVTPLLLNADTMLKKLLLIVF